MHFISLCIVCAGLFLTSCQKDDMAVNPEDALQLREVSFEYAPSDSICVGDSITITYDNGLANDCGKSSIQMRGPGDDEWTAVLQNEEPVDGEVTYTFEPELTGVYEFRAHWIRAGSPASCPDSPPQLGWEEAEVLVVSDCDGGGEEPPCDTTFTGEVVVCDTTGQDSIREIALTFIFPDSSDYVIIQGILDSLEADAEVTVSGGDDVVITQTIPDGTSDRLLTVEFSADECEEIVIQISFEAEDLDADFLTGVFTASDENGEALAPDVAELSCVD